VRSKVDESQFILPGVLKIIKKKEAIKQKLDMLGRQG